MIMSAMCPALTQVSAEFCSSRRPVPSKMGTPLRYRSPLVRWRTSSPFTASRGSDTGNTLMSCCNFSRSDDITASSIPLKCRMNPSGPWARKRSHIGGSMYVSISSCFRTLSRLSIECAARSELSVSCNSFSNASFALLYSYEERLCLEQHDLTRRKM